MSRCGIGIGRVNMNRLRFTRRLKCRIRGGLLGSEQITRICILLILLEFNCCHLCIGNFGTFLEAFLCFLPIASNCDHTFGARHIQLEVHVTWLSHKTRRQAYPEWHDKHSRNPQLQTSTFPYGNSWNHRKPRQGQSGRVIRLSFQG